MAGPRAPTPEDDKGSLGDGPDRSRQEAAHYIASMLESLRMVAHNAQLPFLAYLIGVALEEARNEKNGPR